MIQILFDFLGLDYQSITWSTTQSLSYSTFLGYVVQGLVILFIVLVVIFIDFIFRIMKR